MFDLLNLEPNKVSKDLSSYTNMVYGKQLPPYVEIHIEHCGIKRGG